MPSLNRVMLIGNLGRDPEIRYTQAGNAVANFTLATHEIWNDKQGQRQERTEWHDIVAWDRLADSVQSYLKKGSLVYVEGRLQTRSWEDQQGQRRYRTEVVANVIQFLDRPGSNVSQQAAGSQGANAASGSTTAYSQQDSPHSTNEGGDEKFIKDDIPF